MYVVIVGGGRTGLGLANRLSERDHDLAIVEIDEDRAHELAGELDALVLEGNGSNIYVLIKAGAERAGALAALAPDDEINFMACSLAKELDIPRVVARVNDEKHVSMFEDVGADVTINYISATIGLYERAITSPEMYGLLSLGGDRADVIEVSVSGESGAIGKTINELGLPDLCTVAMITRQDELIPPRGDTEFKKDDRVILVGKSDDVISIGNFFREK